MYAIYAKLLENVYNSVWHHSAQPQKNYLSDSHTETGGIRDLSGSKEVRECKAVY